MFTDLIKEMNNKINELNSIGVKVTVKEACVLADQYNDNSILAEYNDSQLIVKGKSEFIHINFENMIDELKRSIGETKAFIIAATIIDEVLKDGKIFSPMAVKKAKHIFNLCTAKNQRLFNQLFPSLTNYSKDIFKAAAKNIDIITTAYNPLEDSLGLTLGLSSTICRPEFYIKRNGVYYNLDTINVLEALEYLVLFGSVEKSA